MLLRFIGNDKSMGLESGKVYNVEISAKHDLIWIHINWDTRFLSCPYGSIKAMMQNWEEI